MQFAAHCSARAFQINSGSLTRRYIKFDPNSSSIFCFNKISTVSFTSWTYEYIVYIHIVISKFNVSMYLQHPGECQRHMMVRGKRADRVHGRNAEWPTAGHGEFHTLLIHATGSSTLRRAGLRLKQSRNVHLEEEERAKFTSSVFRDTRYGSNWGTCTNQSWASPSDPLAQ